MKIKFVFQPPVAHDRWKEILEALEFGNACSQIQEKLYVGDQDCLTLNIYAPVDAGNATVMVFFHGGGYTGKWLKIVGLCPLSVTVKHINTLVNRLKQKGPVMISSMDRIS